MSNVKLTQPAFPQQAISRAPFRFSEPQSQPRVSSIPRSQRPETGEVAPLSVSPLVYRHVLQFRNGTFLAGYSEDGVCTANDIKDAKIFSIHAVEDAAKLFCGRIIVVLCSPDGLGVRRTILKPPARTNISDSGPASACPTNDASVKASAFAKGSDDEKEALHQASVQEAFTERSKREVETNRKSDGVGTTESENGGHELTQKIGALQTRTERGIDGWAKTDSPLPSEGKKLFLEFISTYLGIPCFGIQAGAGKIPDSYLLVGPHGSTLAISTNVMLLPREDALAILKVKIQEKEKAFGDHR
jgi:hypothetical protein